MVCRRKDATGVLQQSRQQFSRYPLKVPARGACRTGSRCPSDSSTVYGIGLFHTRRQNINSELKLCEKWDKHSSPFGPGIVCDNHELYGLSAGFCDLYMKPSRRYLFRQNSDKTYQWAACPFNWCGRADLTNPPPGRSDESAPGPI